MDYDMDSAVDFWILLTKIVSIHLLFEWTIGWTQLWMTFKAPIKLDLMISIFGFWLADLRDPFWKVGKSKHWLRSSFIRCEPPSECNLRVSFDLFCEACNSIIVADFCVVDQLVVGLVYQKSFIARRVRRVIYWYVHLPSWNCFVRKHQCVSTIHICIASFCSDAQTVLTPLRSFTGYLQ